MAIAKLHQCEIRAIPLCDLLYLVPVATFEGAFLRCFLVGDCYEQYREVNSTEGYYWAVNGVGALPVLQAGKCALLWPQPCVVCVEYVRSFIDVLHHRLFAAVAHCNPKCFRALDLALHNSSLPGRWCLLLLSQLL